MLISVTEGEDKPLKYPNHFQQRRRGHRHQDWILQDAVEFNWETAYSNIQAVRPGMRVFRVSAKTGAGMDEYLGFLASRLAELRPAAV